MLRTIAATAALSLSMPIALALPAQAAPKLASHCHQRDAWTLVDHSSNATVKLKLWQAPDREAADGKPLHVYCAEAFDRQHIKGHSVRLRVDQYNEGEDEKQATGASVRGGDRASLLWTTTSDDKLILVSAHVRGHRTAFAAFVD